MTENSTRPVIALISPSKDTYSETFVRAHAERLPAQVLVLHHGFFPTRKEDDRLLLPLPIMGLDKFLPGLSKTFPNFSQTIDAASSAVQALKTLTLVRYLRKNRVAAVLAEFGPSGASVLDACLRTRMPLIVHFHGSDAFDHRILNKFGAGYRRLFESAAAIIAVSRDMERQLLALGAPRQRLHYNPCGVDCALFSKIDPAANPPLFVSVGRFVDKKAPHLTVLAFQKVAAVYPEARLTMIGDGILWEACKQLTKALEITDKVEFPGPQSHNVVAATMQRARAFVQQSLTTSYGDSEGTPVGVLEAGASGLPVVSTRHGGIKEAVIHQETGLLVEEGDVDGMARHMLELARNPKLAAALGQRAREHISTHYSIEKSIDHLWQIVASTI